MQNNRLVYKNPELGDRILNHIGGYDANNLPASARQAISDLEGRGLSAANVERARRALGLTLEIGELLPSVMDDRDRSRDASLALLANPHMSVVAGELTSAAFVPHTDASAHEQLRSTIQSLGIPDTLSPMKQAQLWAAASRAAGVAPGLVMDLVRKEIMRDAGGFLYVFPQGATDAHMVTSLDNESARTGISYELNEVVEAAKTEEEAERNVQGYINKILAGAPRIAIKPTAIVAQSAAPIATDHMKNVVSKAVQRIFEAAEQYNPNCIIGMDSEHTGLVDMVRMAMNDAVQYFPKVKVDKAIQAYEARARRDLGEWMSLSKTRVEDQGGEPLGARIVCGANKPAEYQMASAMAWRNGAELAHPLTANMVESHAQYMLMVRQTVDLIKQNKFRITVASMNYLTLVDNLIVLSQAGLLAMQYSGNIFIAMLKGMRGTPFCKALMQMFNISEKEMEGLAYEYTPAITFERIRKAFKYYSRRLEELIAKYAQEGTAHSLGETMREGLGSEAWIQSQYRSAYLEALYMAQVAEMQGPQEAGSVINSPRSDLHAWRGINEPTLIATSYAGYVPVPAANFGSNADRHWLRNGDTGLMDVCENMTDPVNIPLEWQHDDSMFHDGQKPEGYVGRRSIALYGPTRGKNLKLADVEYPTGTFMVKAGQLHPYTGEILTEDTEFNPDIDQALETARNHPNAQEWKSKPLADRISVMHKAIEVMKRRRIILDQALMMNAGKAVPEAEGEVDEGMDGTNLACVYANLLGKRRNLNVGPGGDGTATQICPKNFPKAIPELHWVPQLLNGYSVIVKPSGGEDEETIWATYEAVRCFWEAGVPKESLVFLPCDNKQAAYLAKRSNRIGFTGSSKTAPKIKKANPEAEAQMETGGRNVIVIDSTMDPEDAAWIIARSVIGFAGQKCSKPIAVICTADVNMAEIRRHLIGIFNALLVDTALKEHVDVTPLSKEPQPGEDLYERGENCLPGETWIWKHPTMKCFGIREVTDKANFNFAKIAEIFAAVVTLIQIDGDHQQAVSMIAGLPGTLTTSFLSENPNHIKYVLEHCKTGNLYIKDTSTGAKAHQGFGDGIGDSHCGAHGAKTGTIEWNLMNAHVERVQGQHAKYDKELIGKDKTGLRKLLEKLEKGIQQGNFTSNQELSTDVQDAIHTGWSCLFEMSTYFSKKRPAPYQVEGQYDWIQSHAVGENVYRVHPDDTPFEMLGQVFAAVAAGNSLVMSVPRGVMLKLRGLERMLKFKFTELAGVSIIEQSDDQLCEVIRANGQYPNKRFSHISYTSKDRVPKAIFDTAAGVGEDNDNMPLYIDHRPITGDGLNDMITQFRQQSYSWITHHAGDNRTEERRVERAGTKVMDEIPPALQEDWLDQQWAAAA